MNAIRHRGVRIFKRIDSYIVNKVVSDALAVTEECVSPDIRNIADNEPVIDDNKPVLFVIIS